MSTYSAPLRDMHFVLRELAGIELVGTQHVAARVGAILRRHRRAEVHPGGSPLLLSSEGGASGGYPAGPYPAEISYRVDASSQLSTNTVKFVKGGIELADRASYEYLFSLSEALSSPELAGDRFVVEGHASAEGSDYANLILSQRRANAIFEFLASRGVDPGRLLAVGHGESQARFGDHEPEFLRAQDRQVIVFKLAD